MAINYVTVDYTTTAGLNIIYSCPSDKMAIINACTVSTADSPSGTDILRVDIKGEKIINSKVIAQDQTLPELVGHILRGDKTGEVIEANASQVGSSIKIRLSIKERDIAGFTGV